MGKLGSWLMGGFCGLVAAGCAGPLEPARSSAPTPESVTRDQPGGDAPDPHKAALIRLLGQPYGRKSDKFKTLDAHFPDVKNWRRVRFFGYPTRAGFRYGDDHHAVAVLIYRPAEPGETPRGCLERFLHDATGVAKDFGAKVGPAVWTTEKHRPRLRVLGEPLPTPTKPPRRATDRAAKDPPEKAERAAEQRPKAERAAEQRPKAMRRRLRALDRKRRAAAARRLDKMRVPREMPVAYLDGGFATLANDDRYVAAVAAYHSWPDTCLVHGLVVETGEHEDIARAVLERWVREGAPKLRWRGAAKEQPPVQNR